MRYQLVLQFPGDSLADYEQLIALEDRLTTELGNSADVDGYDVGSGETNIFIFTKDPAETFRQVRPILASINRLQAVTAAFRDVSGDRYSLPFVLPIKFSRTFSSNSDFVKRSIIEAAMVFAANIRDL